MRYFPVRALVAVMLVSPLSACGSFLGIHFTRHNPPAERTQAVAMSSTELGRRQLAEGRTGLAVEAFQRALAAGEPVAPAVNGLGVAFAKLGRDDLAKRFFEEALAADPGNPRYADNLARLMRSPAYASRAAAEMTAQVMKDADRMVGSGQQVRAADQQPVAGRLQRVSRGEVRITTAAPQAAPLRSASAGNDNRFKPIIRIALAPKEPEAFKPLVRIALPAAEADDTPSKPAD